MQRHPLTKLTLSLVLFIMTSTACAWPPPSMPPAASQTRPPEIPRETVTIGTHEFKLELAADPESRSTGLMKRDSIEDFGGMLFVHPDESYRSYWMKHCRVDIDLLYLDSLGRIIDTHELKFEPPQRADETELQYESRLKSYRSSRPAQFVIELKAGWLEKLNPQIGDVIELDLKRLRTLARENERQRN
jgi:uncharacterized membrane protein (UPF0127 family)